jgi:hypothetical protein
MTLLELNPQFEFLIYLSDTTLSRKRALDDFVAALCLCLI